MNHDELDVLNARLETLQTQITRMFNFLQGAAAWFPILQFVYLFRSES